MKKNVLIQVVQNNVQEARRKQRAIYAITAAEASSGLLTSCLPSLFLKVILNHLTRRYSLCITHVDGELPVDGVRSAVFWKPPQGNCSKISYFIFLTRCDYLLIFFFFLCRFINDTTQAW